MSDLSILEAIKKSASRTKEYVDNKMATQEKVDELEQRIAQLEELLNK